jgi:plastocyanin
MTQSKRRLVWGSALGAFALAACSGGGGMGGMGPNLPLGGRSSTIVASGSSGSNNGFGNTSGGQYYFSPSPDTVAAGSQVKFSFLDVAHTVTFDTGPAQIANIALTSGADSVRTFPKAGTYTWHCSIHPYMHGTLVAQ